MLCLRALSALLFVASALAVPRLSKGDRFTNWIVTASGPTSGSGQAIEQSNGAGATWNGGASGLVLGPQGTVGFRLAGQNDTAVLVKNNATDALQGEFTHWLTYSGGHRPFNFGISDNSVWIFTNYSAPANSSFVSEAWRSIPISADVSFDTAECRTPVGPWNATVHGKDGHTKLHTSGPHGTVRFNIDDMLKVHNITLSLGKVHVRVHPALLFARYNDVSAGPLVNAHMNIIGGFCDNED